MTNIFVFVAKNKNYSFEDKLEYFLFVLTSLVSIAFILLAFIMFVLNPPQLANQFYFGSNLYIGILSRLNIYGYVGIALLGAVLLTGKRIRRKFVGPYYEFKFGKSEADRQLGILGKMDTLSQKSAEEMLLRPGLDHKKIDEEWKTLRSEAKKK